MHNRSEYPFVLYLSHDGLTDSLGQSQILPYLIGLSPTYNITVVSFEKPDKFQRYGHVVEQMCLLHHLRWQPLIYHRFPPVLSTVYDLLHLRRRVGKILSKQKYRIIHCRSYPVTIVGLWAKSKYGLKLIFDMRGFWVDERVEGGLWNLRNPLYRSIFKFFKKYERSFISKADHIITLTENAKSEVLSWAVASSPITVIPTCADFDHFNLARIAEEERIKMKRKLGIEGHFVLLYLGSWGTWYMTDEMLNFFSVLKQYEQSAKFLLVTTDIADVSKSPFKHDIIQISASRNEVPLYISLCNASVFFILPTYSKKGSSATKLGEIVAMNRPLVTNIGWGDVALYKQQLHFITVNGRETYDEAVQSLLARSDTWESRAVAEPFLSLKAGVELYYDVYEQSSD